MPSEIPEFIRSVFNAPAEGELFNKPEAMLDSHKVKVVISNSPYARKVSLKYFIQFEHVLKKSN